MDAPARKHSLTIILLGLVVIMGIEIVYLIYQNRRLQALLAESAALQILHPGQKVPPINVSDLNGTPVEVQYGQEAPSTLLIWFSPSCDVCRENIAFWNDLYRRFHSNRVRFLTLCEGDGEAARAYVAEHGMSMPVVAVTDEQVIDSYQGRVMPQTAFLTPRGEIANIWPGALEPMRQEEIIAVLHSAAE